jgi:PP-loop superfamily ATP-utilizing enzyme
MGQACESLPGIHDSIRKSVTREKLAQVEKAEEYVKSFGVKELRVRHFGEKAVLEVNPSYME